MWVCFMHIREELRYLLSIHEPFSEVQALKLGLLIIRNEIRNPLTRKYHQTHCASFFSRTYRTRTIQPGCWMCPGTRRNAIAIAASAVLAGTRILPIARRVLPARLHAL